MKSKHRCLRRTFSRKRRRGAVVSIEAAATAAVKRPLEVYYCTLVTSLAAPRKQSSKRAGHRRHDSTLSRYRRKYRGLALGRTEGGLPDTTNIQHAGGQLVPVASLEDFASEAVALPPVSPPRTPPESKA